MAVSVYTGASSSGIVYVNYTGDTPTKDNITNINQVLEAYKAGKMIAIQYAPKTFHTTYVQKSPFILSYARKYGMPDRQNYIFDFVSEYIEVDVTKGKATSCPYCITIDFSEVVSEGSSLPVGTIVINGVTDRGLAKPMPSAHAYTHKTGGDDPIVPSDIGAQSKITANGILKGDGTGTITAADETEVELVDLPIRAESIIIPKGRMRGDVDGDGKITNNDANLIQRHSAGIETLTGVDLWCADVNGNNSVTSADMQIISIYLEGGSSLLTKTPTFDDYYNSWTYVKVDDLTGYWTTEISIAGLTTSNNVIINICETFPMGQFYKAEVLEGKVKIYANRPPINDIPAIIVISSGSGKGSIPSYLDDSSLDYKFSLRLPTASWTGSDPYTQTVTIPNSTANTKVDIQPSEELYDQLVADSVGYLAIKNVDGTLTAVAKGGKPSVKLTVQVTYNNVYA